MSFTIEIDNRDLGNLKLYHKKCGEEIDKIKNHKGKINEYTGFFDRPQYSVVVCKKCKERVWMTFNQSLIQNIKQTAVDGMERRFNNPSYWGKIWKGYNRKKLYNFTKIFVIISLKKIEEKPEKKPRKEVRKKAKKTIGELKEKLVKVEKNKKEAEEKAKKTIKDLKEKLVKAEQPKKDVEKFYCPDCGAQLLSIESFCSFCGANIEDRISEIEKISTSNK